MDKTQVVTTSSLARPVHLSDIVQFHRYAGIPWWRQIWTIGALVLASTGLASYLGFVLLPQVAPTMPKILTIVVGLSGFFYLALYLVWSLYYLRTVKVARLTAENGFSYDYLERGNRREGSAFRLHTTSFEREIIRGVYHSHFFTMGKRYTVGSEDNNSIRLPFAFIELTLPRKVPHIILKNRRSRVISVTGIGFGKTKKLKLEGNFNDTFTIYCPEGYEREALYIFTPDVMAALLDHAGNAEVELIDNKLYIYRKHGTRLDNADVVNKTFHLIGALQAKFDKQTKNYKDSSAFSAKQSSNAAISLRGRRMYLSEVSGLHILWVCIAIATSAAFMLVPYLIGLYK